MGIKENLKRTHSPLHSVTEMDSDEEFKVQDQRDHGKGEKKQKLQQQEAPKLSDAISGRNLKQKPTPQKKSILKPFFSQDHSFSDAPGSRKYY